MQTYFTLPVSTGILIFLDIPFHFELLPTSWQALTLKLYCQTKGPMRDRLLQRLRRSETPHEQRFKQVREPKDSLSFRAKADTDAFVDRLELVHSSEKLASLAE